MLLLGIDIGTSSVKVSVVDAQTQQCLAKDHYPETESAILSPHPGWAEQSPEDWWTYVQSAIRKLHAQKKYDPKDIAAIGIAYQMHGLVMVDKAQQVVHNSIIWCDSRAVETGQKAFQDIGKEKCLSRLLNSPGNFTASKLAWMKQHEPAVYARTKTVMLPGDFIAMKLTGEITTSAAALSEGIFWDFKKNELSEDVIAYYDLDASMIPAVRPVFGEHGRVSTAVALALSLPEGIPVTYKAGDQPNNALSLNVLQPGEVAATAGTSGVIYGVSDSLTADQQSRINSFVHVNHNAGQQRIGVLLCINGAGILNRWVLNKFGNGSTYEQMNEAAAGIKAGAEGLTILPFGNGAERMLNNRTVGAHILGLDLNIHSAAHVYRAAQEGIAFAFRYGLDIMRENGMNPGIIRAGKANMFLSPVFTTALVNSLQVPVELYQHDGSTGAAIGAGLGSGIYTNTAEAFQHFKPVDLVKPEKKDQYEEIYQRWLLQLQNKLTQ